MALSADALTTWERTKDVLSLSDIDQTKTEFLIDAASMYANRRAGRRLSGRDADVRLDGSGVSVLVLPESPAVVTHLWIDPDRLFAEGTELPASDYHVLQDSGVVRLFYGTFPKGYANIRVKGLLGYQPVPADLEQAVIECVAVNLRRLGSPGAIGLKTVSVDGATSSAYEIDWPTTAVMVFDSYRRTNI